MTPLITQSRETRSIALLEPIYHLTTILEPIELMQMFPQQRPLEVELGSGDGSFLLDYAGAHPERNFIGIERLLGRIRKMGRKARRAELTNLRGIRIESGYLLDYLLPRHSVAGIHVYFPDPWPKRKHRRHRLINERFPRLARGVLSPGGRVFLRTDDQDYFQQMVNVFRQCAEFLETETPEELCVRLTDFERDFQSRGIKTLRAAYQVRPVG